MAGNMLKGRTWMRVMAGSPIYILMTNFFTSLFFFR